MDCYNPDTDNIKPGPDPEKNRSQPLSSSCKDFPSVSIVRLSREALQPYIIATAIVASVIAMVIIITSDFFLEHGNPLLRKLIYLGPVIIGSFIYMVVSTIIIRLVMLRITQGSVSIRGTIFFIARVFPSLIFIIGILFAAAWGLVRLAAMIPNLEPIRLGLLLLPVYCAVLFLILIICSTIWFFPAIIADWHVPVLRFYDSMLRFIFRHISGLCFILPVMLFISLILLVPVAILHSSELSIPGKDPSMLAVYDSSTVFNNILLPSSNSLSQIESPDIPTDIGLSEYWKLVVSPGVWILTVILTGLWLLVLPVISAYFYIRMEYRQN